MSGAGKPRGAPPLPASIAPGAPASISEAPATQTHGPSEWLDRLLGASNELPPDASIAAAARAVLEAVEPSLEGVALGVCAPDGRGGTIDVRVGSEGDAGHPARLFPSYASEVVHSIPGDEGSTLHVGMLDRCSLDGSSFDATPGDLPMAMRQRLVATLGATLRRARAFEAARQGASDVQGLEAKMIHAERLAGLGQIAAGIVHDLNTPLTTVVAYADYLRKKWGSSTVIEESDKQRLVRIHEAAERLLSFSRDLMAYSRPSPHVPAPVDIQQVLERALAFCEHAVTSSRVVLERDFEQVRPVRGVAGQLIQVFVNLVTNACQAVRSDGTGRVSLTTRPGPGGDSVIVVVADDGVGLPADVDRLFEPFFTTKDGGTGLGLAIVRKIIASHGGEVRAERRQPTGTAFVVELPLAAQAPTDPAGGA
jgi:two-component system NtrC family sensor kinase